MKDELHTGSPVHRQLKRCFSRIKGNVLKEYTESSELVGQFPQPLCSIFLPEVCMLKVKEEIK